MLEECDGLILLVRHADAGDRSNHVGVDALRPLSEKGRWQAEEIAKSLVQFRPTKIVTSRAVRCYSTVAPLASACSLEIEERAELFEGGDPKIALDQLLHLVTLRDEVVVACSHGDVIPWIVSLVDESGAAHGVIPKIKKGSVTALSLVGGEIIKMDFISRPKMIGG